MANIVIPTITENGTTTLATKGKYCPENVDIVVDVQGGGGGNLPPEAFVIMGDCFYRFSYDGWDWFIEQYGNQITTENITNASYMFYNSEGLTEIPFDINAKNCFSFTQVLGMSGITDVPHISMRFDNYNRMLNISSLLYTCRYVRDAENLFESGELSNFLNNSIPTSQYSAGCFNSIFNACYSLREVPSWFRAIKINKNSPHFPSASSSPYYMTFYYCVALDEALDIPISDCDVACTSNMFGSMFSNCFRLKRVTFEKSADGTPKSVKWKTQTIDLSFNVGYVSSKSHITDYNSGITADKEVVGDTSYQALKDDADWYTALLQYSRYNHDSAVETMDSLPDTSAYLASAGGTNTIKFKGAAGSSTDGGAINTLTAEEIAVATAKGWTVSLV